MAYNTFSLVQGLYIFQIHDAVYKEEMVQIEADRRFAGIYNKYDGHGRLARAGYILYHVWLLSRSIACLNGDIPEKIEVLQKT